MPRKKGVTVADLNEGVVDSNGSIATRFQKGESGNPDGRPKGSRRPTSYKERTRRFLNQKVVARDGEKRRRITTEAAAFLKLRAEALNGSIPALNKLLKMGEDAGTGEDEVPPQTELSAEDREILKRYLERIKKEEEDPKK